MKYVALAVLLAVMQAPPPVPRKAANPSGRTRNSIDQQRQNNKNPPTQPESTIQPVGPQPNQDGSQSKAADNTNKPVIIRELPSVSVTKDRLDKLYIFFTGVLVVVGSVGVRAAYRTLKAIERQADLIGRQVTLVERQANLMEQQSGILQESVAAAKSSADAAKASVELFINKERARIRIEMEEPWLEVGQAHIPEYPEVRYRIEIYGSTEAFIDDHEASAYTAESADAPPPNPINVPMGLPSVIKSNTQPIRGNCFIFPKMTLEQSDVDKIHKGVSFLHFRGAIRYKDVFSKDRHTTFKYLWKVGKPHKDGTVFGYWLKCGKEEDNEET